MYEVRILRIYRACILRMIMGQQISKRNVNFQGTRPNNCPIYAKMYDRAVYRFMACLLETRASATFGDGSRARHGHPNDKRVATA